MTPTPLTPTPNHDPSLGEEILGAKDPRAIAEKIVEINGKKYRVNVMPPGLEEHDAMFGCGDMVWPQKNPTTSASIHRAFFTGSFDPNVEGDE
jgi:hypothetical protein